MEEKKAVDDKELIRELQKTVRQKTGEVAVVRDLYLEVSRELTKTKLDNTIEQAQMTSELSELKTQLEDAERELEIYREDGADAVIGKLEDESA